MNNISKVSEITYQDIADYGRFGMRNGDIQEEMPAFDVVDQTAKQDYSASVGAFHHAKDAIPYIIGGGRLTYTLSL